MRHYRLGRQMPAVDAIGDADTMVGVPGQYQTRMPANQRLDAGYVLHMPDVILRHGSCVTADATILGLARDAEQLLQIPTHRTLHIGIGKGILRLLQGAADEGTQENRVFRCPAGELDAAERAGHERPPLDCGHHEAHAVERMGNLDTPVGKIDRGRRGVGNGLQAGRQFGIDGRDEPSRLRGSHGEAYGIG